MSEDVTMWVATQKGRSVCLSEHHGLQNKVFVRDLITREFSVVRKGRTLNLGTLLAVDMTPEALLEGLDIEEGDRLLLVPAGR